MQFRSIPRLAAAAMVALVCLLALSANAASGPISDSDTHYFVLLWAKKYPLNYVWSGDNLCKWEGISCDTVKQQVTMLLPKVGLTGTIPMWGSKSGFTPANVKVISINLAKNKLTGAFPAHYGQLTKLQELYLLDTSLSGTIPQAWNNLASLTIVDVSNTKACGGVPAWDQTSMPSLQYMHFTNNSLMHGTVPASVMTFSKVSFNTSGCHLCGCMPAGTSPYIRVQLSRDQPQLAMSTCATSNVCSASDLTCITPTTKPSKGSSHSEASAPVLALSSLVAVVASVVAALAV